MSIEVYSQLSPLQRQQPTAPVARAQELTPSAEPQIKEGSAQAAPQLAQVERQWLAESLGQVQVTQEALQQVEQALHQAQQLVEQEAHLSDDQKAATQTQLDEIALLVAETIQQAQFNGEPLLSAEAPSKVVPESLLPQATVAADPAQAVAAQSATTQSVTSQPVTIQSASPSPVSERPAAQGPAYRQLGLPGGLAQAVSEQTRTLSEAPAEKAQAAATDPLHKNLSIMEFRLKGQPDIYTGEIKEWPDSPYFSSGAYQAVQAFRASMAEMLQAPLAAEPDQVVMGAELGAAARDLVNQQAGEAVLGEWQQAENQVQGHTLRLEGRVEQNADQQLQFDASSALTFEVNGTQLMMQGPFIRFVGPVDEDAFSLPKDEQGEPYVAVQPQQLLQALSHAEADPRQWMRVEDPGLPASLEQAVSSVQQLEGQLDGQLQALTGRAEVRPLENHQQALALVQETQSLIEQQQAAAVAAQGQLSTVALLNLVEPGR
ncbi:hypothetical protein V6U78_05325 [Marinospirillum sp. MEB164]|uniref:Flagellar hook-length control protein FliK n=1 Tax=Marinospirillum alkalitolerans TaxID=3123374 RepID=A0ABW8PVZ0_9GAMM